MDLLRLIYLVANTLAGIAVAGTLVVIGVHVARAQWDRRRKDARCRLSSNILQFLQSGEATEPLVELLRQDRKLSAALLQELAELITGGQRTALLTLARSAGLERWLLNELRSRRASRRLTAVEALGLFESPEIVAALNTGLDDTDPDVRIGAALSLANQIAVPALPMLVGKLNLKRPHRPLALRRLFAKVAPGQLEEMFAVAEDRMGSPFIRPFAIEAIGATGRAEFADRLTLLMDDPDPTIRATLLGAIATLGRNPKRDIIAIGLQDKFWEVSTQAIAAARRLDRFELAPRVAALTHDKSWWVRFRADECLMDMYRASVDILRARAGSGEGAALDTPGGSVQRAARRALPATREKVTQ